MGIRRRVSNRVRVPLRRVHEQFHAAPRLPNLDRLDVGTETIVSAHTYFAPTVVRFDYDPEINVSIGRFCGIAKNVEFFTGGEHRVDWVTTFPLRGHFDLEGVGQDGIPFSRGQIVIENDVWIAYGATVMSGVRIGSGAVVGARAVVRKDVPPYGIVTGNPAELVRYRFPPAIVESLLRIAWWDWPIEQVLDNVALLSSPDVSGFCARFDPQFVPEDIGERR